jgi:hypothetical protein
MTRNTNSERGNREVWHHKALENLNADIRLVLMVQLKVIIDEIEDCEKKVASNIGARVQPAGECFLPAQQAPQQSFAPNG